MDQVHKFGRLAPAPQRLSDLTAYARRPLPAPPAEVVAPALVYPMDGNQTYGDCTIAAAQHADQVWAHLEEFAYEPPAESVIASTYFALTGGADTGLVEATVLKAWQTEGLFGNKIAAYAPIAPKHLVTVKQAVELFGLAYTGILVPAVAEEQFSAGQTWELTGGSADHNIVGGHAVPIVGYNATGPIFVTWGQLQQATWRWWLTYAEECWCIIGAEVAQAGHLHGLDLAALQADLAAVADPAHVLP